MATAALRSLRRHVILHKSCISLPSRVVGASRLTLGQSLDRLSISQPRFFSLSSPLRTPSTAALASQTHTSTTVTGSPLTKDEIVHKDESSTRKPFNELNGNIHRSTLKAITTHPFSHTHMTPVQEAVLGLLPDIAQPYDPNSISKVPRDLLVRAKTGTGKTLAFLVPAIEARVKAIQDRVNKAVEAAGSRADNHLKFRAATEFARSTAGALIISPTRELATQIAEEAIKLTTHHDGFEVRLFTGGESRGAQLRNWNRGRKDIVVATPGRLRDMLENEPSVQDALKGVQLLVLDEADTLLDMGFRDDLDAIIDCLPQSPERQTFLFSATISRAVEQVARRALNRDSHTYINTVSHTDSPVHAHVPQFHTVLPSANEQLPHLLNLIAHDQLVNPHTSKVILFCSTTKMTQLVTTVVKEMTRPFLPAGKYTQVYEIHSRLTQSQRTRASDNFRSKKAVASILVTSDVSARGVDYPNVTRVIQLGIPASADQYIHRVGRTGRSGGVVGRGDLVMLPWEVGFVRSLSAVPLKPVTFADFSRQLKELATQNDEDPKALLAEATHNPDISNHQKNKLVRYYKHPYASSLESLPTELKALLSSIDPAAVEETFSAMIGYYSSRVSDLGTNIGQIIQGCKDWATEAMALPQPPYVSEALLRKLGALKNKAVKQRRSSLFDSRSRSRDSPWADNGGGRDFRRRGGRNNDAPFTSGFGLKGRQSKHLSFRDEFDEDSEMSETRTTFSGRGDFGHGRGRTESGGHRWTGRGRR